MDHPVRAGGWTFIAAKLPHLPSYADIFEVKCHQSADQRFIVVHSVALLVDAKTFHTSEVAEIVQRVLCLGAQTYYCAGQFV